MLPKDLADYYALFCDYRHEFTPKDKEEYARELNRLANLPENRKYEHTLNFLYATDIAARMPHEVARDLIELIGDYDDDVIYGYAGRGVCAAKFADFKEILQDAYKTKKGFWWR